MNQKECSLSLYTPYGRFLCDVTQQNRIRFHGRSLMRFAPGECIIAVHGKTQEWAQQIRSEAGRVILQAGDAYSTIQLFSGEVDDVTYTGENEERVTLITLTDGQRFINGSINHSVSAGITVHQLCVQLAENTRPSVQVGNITPRADRIRLPRGMALLGSPGRYLRQAEIACNAVCYLKNNRLHLCSALDNPRAPDLVLQKENCIGQPEMRSSALCFNCRFTPGIILGASFTHPDINGIWQAVQISFAGDTDGDEWKMCVTAVSAGIRG